MVKLYRKYTCIITLEAQTWLEAGALHSMWALMLNYKCSLPGLKYILIHLKKHTDHSKVAQRRLDGSASMRGDIQNQLGHCSPERRSLSVSDRLESKGT